MCAFSGTEPRRAELLQRALFVPPEERLAFALARRCRETCLSWPFGWRFAWIAFFSAARLCPGVSDRAPVPGSSLEADASDVGTGVGGRRRRPGTSWRASPLSPSRVDSVDVADVAETTDRDRGRRRALTRGVPDDGVDDDEP